ncbi:MAG: nucleic acid-binding protein [Dehalococcoidia bacterium]
MNPRRGLEFTDWLKASRQLLVIPEIADYEVRRELIRAGLPLSLRRLDALVTASRYQPLSTSIMRSAARLWAQSRQQGRPTSDPHSLDADVILAATALSIAADGHQVIVATDNARHLGLFVDARHWSDIEFA